MRYLAIFVLALVFCACAQNTPQPTNTHFKAPNQNIQAQYINFVRKSDGIIEIDAKFISKTKQNLKYKIVWISKNCCEEIKFNQSTKELNLEPNTKFIIHANAPKLEIDDFEIVFWE